MKSDLFFKQLQYQLDQRLPFVGIAQNYSLKAHLQDDDALVEVDDFRASGFVFCPFSAPDKNIIFPTSHSACLESELKSEPITQETYSIEESQEAKRQHIELVDKALRYIKTGLAEKIVCTRKIKVPQHIEPIDTLKKLAIRYPKAYSYCWYHPKVGLWLGATPERFIHLDRNRLKTVALAGTLDATKSQQPKWRAKEKQEQQMVTDYIADTLKPYSDHVQVQDVENVKAGNLWHLKTKISAEIEPENLSDVIDKLHPTSAVCGLPQAKARSFIQKYEHFNREYYSGFLGELNVKKQVSRRRRSLNQEQLAIKSIKTVSDLYVNLRCMKVCDEHIELFVGGGITGDSEPKAEYLETVAKSTTLLSVL